MILNVLQHFLNIKHLVGSVPPCKMLSERTWLPKTTINCTKTPISHQHPIHQLNMVILNLYYYQSGWWGGLGGVSIIMFNFTSLQELSLAKNLNLASWKKRFPNFVRQPRFNRDR